MDLKKMLQIGHSKAQTNAIASYIGTSENKFKALVKLYLEGPYRITQRAAAPLNICVERQPSLVLPYLKKILDLLKKPGTPDAVKRNTMRLLQFIEIPVKYHGAVLELCFKYLQNRKEAVAIRVFSMSVLNNLVKDQLDLKKELRILLEDELPFATPAFKSRAKKILKRMESNGTH